MLPSTGSKKKIGKPQAKDESVSEEIQQEEKLNSIQPMGNEYANIELNADSGPNFYTKLLRGANADNMLDISEYLDKKPLDLSDEIDQASIEEDAKSSSGNKNGSLLGKSEDSIDLNDSMYMNTSTNIVNEEWLDKVKEKKAKKKKAKEGIDNKKPDQKEIKAAFNIAENIIEEEGEKKEKEKPEPPDYVQPSTYARDPDLIAERGKHKRKKKTTAPKKDAAPQLNNLIANAAPQGKQPAANDAKQADQSQGPEQEGLGWVMEEYWKGPARERLLKNEDVNQNPEMLSTEMKKVQDWDFEPQKLDKVEELSGFRKFLSYTAAGMGKLFSLALEILTLGHFWRAKSKIRQAFKRDDSWQEKKDHRTIPGWNGAKFSSRATSGEDVMADFRRVPTVWSRLTAAKAAEKVVENGEEKEKPPDPVVSVMVEQPKSGSSNAMATKEVGHTMLGIEYSRKSAISGRYERYNLQYGFYPQYGSENMSTSMMSLKKNLTVPGLMKDDTGHTYDVSRRYPAKPEQVNAIFKASEKYADRGYSIYDRNCSTFVKEMIVDTAHLETGGQIFQRSEIRYSSLANLGLFGVEAFTQNAKAGAENTIMDLSEREDETYQGYGNKIASAEDWANFKESMEAKEPGVIKDTFVPGEIGERMRRMEGEGTGEIGSYNFNEPLKDNEGNLKLSLGKICTKINNYGREVTDIFKSIYSPEQQNELPFEMVVIANTLAAMGGPLSTLNRQIHQYIDDKNKNKNEKDKLNRNNVREASALSGDQLRKARAEMSENVAKINLLLFNYLKNDRRMHTPLMNLLSLMTYGIRYIDDLYAESVRGGDRQDEVTNIRDKVEFTKIKVKAGDKQAEMTPSRYESYIQIYKNPEAAVAAYTRLKELNDKKDKHDADPDNFEGLTSAESKEFEKLDKLDDLADEFVLSHRYMTEKNEYSQQDIDYAFQLQYKETNGLDMNNRDTNAVVEKYSTAGGIYISIFMNKFFKDLKETWMKEPDEGGISMEETKDTANVQTWLDDYLSDRVNQKKDGFGMIVKGIYRSLKAAAPAGQEIKDEDVLKKLAEVIEKTSIDPYFSSIPDMSPEGEKENMGAMILQYSIKKVTEDKKFNFNAMVKNMIDDCKSEDKGKKPPK